MDQDRLEELLELVNLYVDGSTKPREDKTVLNYLYWSEGLSLVDCGKVLGCSDTTVKYWLDKHDIETRKKLNHRPPTYYTMDDGRKAWATCVDYKKILVKESRLLATLLVDDIRELRDKHVHHQYHRRFNFLDGIEVMDPDEHMAGHQDKGAEMYEAL